MNEQQAKNQQPTAPGPNDRGLEGCFVEPAFTSEEIASATIEERRLGMSRQCAFLGSTHTIAEEV